MTTQQEAAHAAPPKDWDTPPEAPADRQIGENVAIMMHRAGIKQTELAAATGLSQPTLSRRMSGQQSWFFWEVEAVAGYFCLSFVEMASTLPSFEEWQGRWDAQQALRACRDSNPKPSVLESRRHLTLVGGVNRRLTTDRIPAGWPIPEPRRPEPDGSGEIPGEVFERHLRAV